MMTPLQVNAATVELIMSSQPTKPGIFPVFIFVDSEQVPTIGTDLLIKYDPDQVAMERVEFSDLYPQTHQPKVDQTAHTVRFSATNEYNTYQPVTGLVATAYFRYLKQPKPPKLPKNENTQPTIQQEPPLVELVWAKDATNDTNLVSTTGQDLLVDPPPPLKIDPNYVKGKVAGVFSDSQQALLDEFGIIAEVTSVKPKINWILTSLGLVILLSIFTIVILIFWKRRKKSKASKEAA